MGGRTTITQPTPPPQPSTADAMQAWVQALPQIFETQLKYAPLEAAQQVALAREFAQPLGAAYLEAQRAMYPETTALQEDLATQAGLGMGAEVPDWMKAEYLSGVRGQLGTNVASRIGADVVSRGLLQQRQDWQNYYRNLGLSLAGRQPLAQPTMPQYSQYMSGFTPQVPMGYMASTYSPYAGAYANMYGTNWQQAQAQQQLPFQWMQGVGNLLTGFTGAMRPV